MKKLVLSIILSAFLSYGQAESTKKYDKELVRIQKIVRAYQHKFDMDEIIIGVDLVTLKDLPPNACGLSTWHMTQDMGFGLIWVLRSDQYNKGICTTANIKSDQKNTVVHEIGHFVMRYAMNEEVGVAAFANVIVPPHPAKEKKARPAKKQNPKKVDPDTIFDDYPSKKRY